MSPAAIRSLRLQELSRLVGRLNTEGVAPTEILSRLKVRSYQMAAKGTAEEYIAEIVRRHFK